MTKQQRQTIEREFFACSSEPSRRKNVIAEAAYAHFGTDYSEPRVKSSPAGNSAENRLVRLLDEEERATRWCTVFQKTMERFRWTQKDELMRRRYLGREPYLVTCDAMCLSPSTYYSWTEDILLVAFRWAQELKIM